MSESTNEDAFRSASGPLYSLSGAVLLIGASGRLSHAVVVGFGVVFVYAAALLLLKLLRSFVPRPYAYAVRLIVSVFWAAVYGRVAGIAWPPAARELSLYIGAVPLCLIASGLFERTDNGSVLEALKVSAAESLVLFSLLTGFALVREPIGYGTLTLPSASGSLVLFGSEFSSAYSLRSVSAAAGAFLLLGYALSYFRNKTIRWFPKKPSGGDAQ